MQVPATANQMGTRSHDAVAEECRSLAQKRTAGDYSIQGVRKVARHCGCWTPIIVALLGNPNHNLYAYILPTWILHSMESRKWNFTFIANGFQPIFVYFWYSVSYRFQDSVSRWYLMKYLLCFGKCFNIIHLWKNSDIVSIRKVIQLWKKLPLYIV